MARSNLNLRVALIVLGPPAGLENDDSFADRIPPGMARFNLNLPRLPTVLGPPEGWPRKWRQFHRSQPPWEGEV
eukprot:7062137-Pyramimonas_sp.AAC.1